MMLYNSSSLCSMVTGVNPSCNIGAPILPGALAWGSSTFS